MSNSSFSAVSYSQAYNTAPETPERSQEWPERTKRQHRDWLYDRINGKSRTGNDRPPCFLCYPPPILKYCPALLEENCICRIIGAIGCCSPSNETVRAWIMLMAFLADLTALNATVSAALAMTTSINLLKRTPWAFGVVTTSDDISELAQVSISIGLRAIILRDDSTGEERAVEFDDFCTLANRGMERYINAEDCDNCSLASRRFMVIPMLVAAAACVPSLFTAILREYSNYDVNCQRCSAYITSLATLGGAAMALSYFQEECFPSFQDENFVDASTEKTTTYEWSTGIGQYCIYAALGLKVFSLLIHCMLPTPTITRNENEKRDYERIPYKGQINREPEEEDYEDGRRRREM